MARFLPVHVTTYSDIPAESALLYQDDDVRGGYSLSPAGKLLQLVRETLTERSVFSLPSKNKPVLERQDWLIAVAVATPQERRELLAAAGRGEIRVMG